MVKNTSILCGLAATVLFLNVAQAGTIEVFYCSQGYFNYKHARLSLIESFSELDPVTVTGGGVALSDTTFTIAKTIANDTGITWTGYELTLDPGGNATFVPDSASSTKFLTVNYPSARRIEFFEPVAVLPGQIVVLQFDVHVPGSDSFTFSLTQEPIPEPATVVLLGLGALVLLARRRA